MRNFVWMAGMAALILAPTQALAAKATAEIMNTEGKVIGNATLEDGKGGVRLTISAEGIEPGVHGFHVHEKGECKTPDFKSAGGHFNPTGTEHGLWNPKGAHKGDMPNLVVKDDGKAEAVGVLRGLSVKKGKNSVLDKDGSALVIHAGPDDHRSDPAGDAGGRVACGVIKSAK